MPNRRVARVNELIRSELADVISRELKTPLPGVVSITEVQTTPDLRHARVFISVLGTAEDRKTAFAALQRATGFLRHALAGRLALRYTPELVLQMDTSMERGAHLLELIREVESEPDQSQEELPERP